MELKSTRSIVFSKATTMYVHGDQGIKSRNLDYFPLWPPNCLNRCILSDLHNNHVMYELLSILVLWTGNMVPRSCVTLHPESQSLLRTKFDLVPGSHSKFWKSSEKASSYSFTVKLLDYFSLSVRYLLKVYCHQQQLNVLKIYKAKVVSFKL